MTGDSSGTDEPSINDAASSGFTRPERGAVVATRPEQMRALTHPLRLEILDLLADHGELTATRCAELTGESVASCSYHLRQLAKYDFVERAPGDGKEKPWRSKRDFSVRPDIDTPGSLQAAQAFGDLYIGRVFERIRAWMSDVDRDDPAWLFASTQTSGRTWATRDELDALSRALEELTDHLQGRWEDPSLRPPGSRPVNFFGTAWADIPETTGNHNVVDDRAADRPRRDAPDDPDTRPGHTSERR